MTLPKVFFVLPEQERYSGSGGGAISTVTREVARELIRLGRSVAVLTPKHPDPPYGVGSVTQLSSSGTPTSLLERTVWGIGSRIAPATMGPRARYVRQVLRVLTERVARRVVIANDPALAVEVGHMAPDIKVILWLHNFLSPQEAQDIPRLPRTVRIVTVSQAVKVWLAREYELPLEDITVIHNGVNRDYFHPPAEEVEHRPVRVICHGRIDPNKGQLLAAQAVARLRDQGRAEIDLAILGSPATFGHDSKSVHEYVQSLNSAMEQAGGTFTGRLPVDAVGDILRAHDIALLLPTVPDPFPLSGLEALACGCAIVAIPLGGVDEMVGDAAVRVRPSVEAVANALESLADSPRMLSSYRTRARERGKQFRWDEAARIADAILM